MQELTPVPLAPGLPEVDPDIIPNVYQLHRRALEAYAERRGVPPDRCGDLVQEMFLLLLKKQETFRPLLQGPAQSSYAWLRTRVFWRAVNDKARSRQEAALHEPLTALDHHAAPAESSSKQISKEKFYRSCEKAFERVDPELMEAFVSVYVEGKTLTQTAAEAGLPISTLVSRLKAASKVLQPIIERLRGRHQRIFSS